MVSKVHNAVLVASRVLDVLNRPQCSCFLGLWHPEWTRMWPLHMAPLTNEMSPPPPPQVGAQDFLLMQPLESPLVLGAVTLHTHPTVGSAEAWVSGILQRLLSPRCCSPWQ